MLGADPHSHQRAPQPFPLEAQEEEEDWQMRSNEVLNKFNLLEKNDQPIKVEPDAELAQGMG